MARGSTTKFGLEPVVTKDLKNPLSPTGLGSGEQGKIATQQIKNTLSGFIDLDKGAFGGNGTDGRLVIESGTTTLDANSANVLIKNYTSIYIASGATLTISNKATTGTILILKCSGNITCAGTIQMSGMGASGGVGTTGQEGFGIIFQTTSTAGVKGDAPAAGVGGAGGVAGVKVTYPSFYTTGSSGESLLKVTKSINVFCGSGGGGGDSYNGGNGNGGNGGGGVIIECKGDLNLTGGVINVSGAAGAAGTTGSDGSGGGGGGGGAAGSITILYNNNYIAGTYTRSGGAGGAGGNGGAGAGGGGGGGGAGAGSMAQPGKAGGAGGNTNTNGTAGQNVGAGNPSAGAGGGGGAGVNTGGNPTGGAGGTNTGTSSSEHLCVLQNTMFA